jgi:hypothetical protein
MHHVSIGTSERYIEWTSLLGNKNVTTSFGAPKVSQPNNDGMCYLSILICYSCIRTYRQLQNGFMEESKNRRGWPEFGANF